MSLFSDLEKQYFELDNFYASREFEARSKGYTNKERAIKLKRDLNTHAYFLFAFTRFEDHIRDETSKLILEKQSNLKNWKNRAAWDILPSQKNSGRLALMNRVALLTDKSKNDYIKVNQYYHERNTIGHGGNFTIPINMTNVFQDFKGFINKLKK
jgi:hypothetical protein